ncbi:MAG: hypothetical protein IPI89_00830 [Propionivibrio sp.]|nr:hypothetical protein [Propionivibrio sp.]MBK7565617.1 hypothetical protein [Propionivibrio sp.]MBK9029041.1 hypothetical protein [Propionivibrio sp.]
MKIPNRTNAVMPGLQKLTEARHQILVTVQISTDVSKNRHIFAQSSGKKPKSSGTQYALN